MIDIQLPKLFSVISLTVCLGACVDNSSAPQQAQQEGASIQEFDFLDMMANYADNIIIPNYQVILQSAQNLAAADGPLSAYCAGIDSAEASALREEAFVAWGDLQQAIQRSESHILGPVLDNGGALLNRINSYNGSDLSLCGIDQAVVLASQDSNFEIGSRTSNQRGVTALEYLLFEQSLLHNCPSQINETADWDQRPEAERQQLRCAYGQIVAADIAESAQQLVDAWSPTVGNYRLEFINPNNLQSSFKALSDALFYLDVDVKDRKLGIPTGINEACSEASCADAVESPYAEASVTHIRHNLEGFRSLMTGGEGLGFDDVIGDAGVPGVSTQILDATDDAIQFIDSLDSSLKAQAAAIVNADDEAACANALANPSSPSEQPACQLYGLIKLITDDLKVDFVAAVNVDLPERSQSDND